MKLRYKKKIAALRSRLSASRGYGVSGLMLIGGERSRVDLLDFAVAIHDNQALQDQRIYKLEYERLDFAGPGRRSICSTPISTTYATHAQAC